MCKLARLFVILASIALMAAPLACSSTGPEFQYERDASLKSLITAKPGAFPAARFIVCSDTHIFAPALGTDGAAFQAYLDNDRKLLRESPQIMQALVNNIAGEKADFVLVSGDLTKDGELASHQLTASFLAQIEKTGKKVYVVPGNHDILNPQANSYSGDKVTRVPNVTPEEFAQVYSAFGYNEALYRDTTTLSYVAEPVPGLWLLALDACEYRLNKEEAVTNGAFTADTLRWIEDRLIEAARSNKSVIVMMHHNVMEHYKGQQKYFGDYIVDNYEEIGKLFAEYNVQLAFTGHYHAQDITEEQWSKDGKLLYDIETGSLVTYPCPYRIVTIGNGSTVQVRSKSITAIESHPTGFLDYARDFVNSGIIHVAVKTLKENGVSQAGAELMGKQVGTAFIAHYSGDEKLPAGQVAISSRGAGFRGWLVLVMRKGLITGIWKDLPPADNNVDLAVGAGR